MQAVRKTRKNFNSMEMLQSILIFITKLALPLALYIIMSDVVMMKTQHYYWDSLPGKNTYLYSSVLAVILGAVCVLNLLVDICYLFKLGADNVVGKASIYFVDEQHSTIYGFFKYGFIEKPIRTWIYLAYIIVCFMFFLVLVRDNSRAARKKLRDIQ